MDSIASDSPFAISDVGTFEYCELRAVIASSRGV
jgi:hypothetical protein